MSILGQALAAAKSAKAEAEAAQDSSKTGIPENQISGLPADELVNLSLRVSKRRRLHWLISAKQQGSNLSAVIIEAMIARFGEPTPEA